MTRQPEADNSGSGSSDDPVVFDRHGALDRFDGDRVALREIVRCFLQDAPRQILRLGSTCAVRDWPEAERIAHSLRGASSNVGAEGAARAAFRLENAARVNSASGCARHFHELEEALALFRRAVSRTEFAVQDDGAMKEDHA